MFTARAGGDAGGIPTGRKIASNCHFNFLLAGNDSGAGAIGARQTERVGRAPVQLWWLPCVGEGAYGNRGDLDGAIASRAESIRIGPADLARRGAGAEMDEWSAGTARRAGLERSGDNGDRGFAPMDQLAGLDQQSSLVGGCGYTGRKPGMGWPGLVERPIGNSPLALNVELMFDDFLRVVSHSTSSRAHLASVG